MKKIKAVTHPIPTEYANRIYNKGKTVFVGKKFLNKVSAGDKFVIYESYGAKAYTGWAVIKTIKRIKSNLIFPNYGEKLMITAEELKEYSKGRTEMNVIEFENFENFKKPVKPKRFVSVGGKYIYKDEFNMIKNNKD